MNFPEDAITEILSRLHVQALSIFKCVCKSWNNLIKEPHFVSNHLINWTNSSTNKDNVHLLISRRDDETNKRVISLSTDNALDTFVDQNSPPFINETFGHIRLLGPCNGLVCLYGYPDSIALWNPAIREFKKLPKSTIPRPQGKFVLGGDIGFGYDSTTNDYKVIQILFCCSKNEENVYQVEIYNVSTGAWRKYNADLPANIMYRNVWSTCYKNEIFCWWAQDGDTELVLSFDMRNEEFKKKALPIDVRDLEGEDRVTRAILPFGESIALLVYAIKQVEKVFDIWVIKSLDAEECWTRLPSIGPVSRVERPLGFWKNGQLILENSCRELVLYDDGLGKVRYLGVHGKRDRLEVLVYKESLVSVNTSQEFRELVNIVGG
ncbi:F-box/kelch-repeat protein [Heracleum sosnowskyi]|uniref:F-box/kelch-repeat protein n=1 Tax=Heracleum sosnowskyi TaxID=360622 RepID=A0AAD8N389_9APIA|nr:F-box/kelch-repeat protein [Heracleum sosnowskyi]